MDAGRSGLGNSRFVPVSASAFDDSAYGDLAALASGAMSSEFEGDRDELHDAIGRTRDWLLAEQHDDGHWCGELEGDSILESEYLLLLAWLGREQSALATGLAAELRHRQEPHGGWAMYPGGPADVSASVKAYLSLRIVGDAASAPHMQAAREAVLAAGGAERVNSFTRYYLALLGLISYDQCPAVPPELALLPHWCPFNIYEMSAWSRTIIIPLSLLWAFRPSRNLPGEGLHIRELFLKSPEQLPVCMDKAEFVETAGRFGVDWQRVFRGVDRVYKTADRWRLLAPLRRASVRRAADWMIARFEASDGLGAIFPPIIWSVVALKCLGHSDDDPLVRGQLRELERLCIQDAGHDRIRCQPCKSPVWDTALATIALREAGLPPQHSAIREAVGWLLSKEVRRRGDWTLRRPTVEPSGWAFEYHNEFYPDVDDTSMVVMALTRSLPSTIEGSWGAEFLLESPAGTEPRNAAVLCASGVDAAAALDDVDDLAPMLTAVWRGVRWILAMQSRDGGWGAFDADNTRWLFTQVPFADHNAMIDPSTADLAGRMLEMFGLLHAPQDHPAIARATEFVSRGQEADGAWYGRWGVNYIYGTWQCLLGLATLGISTGDDRIRRGAAFLKATQQACGGWGESCASYDDPATRGVGTPTASQTAWALMGLVAAGDADSDAAHRAVRYLTETQNPDGTWDEAEMTGTGFPQVFYLKYHFYRIYFPLMALCRYEQATRVR